MNKWQLFPLCQNLPCVQAVDSCLSSVGSRSLMAVPALALRPPQISFSFKSSMPVRPHPTPRSVPIFTHTPADKSWSYLTWTFLAQVTPEEWSKSKATITEAYFWALTGVAAGQPSFFRAEVLFFPFEEYLCFLVMSLKIHEEPQKRDCLLHRTHNHWWR